MKYKHYRLSDFASGAVARNYRHKIAGMGRITSDAMLAYKYKLEANSLEPVAFDDIKSQYKIIAGTEIGTLTYYACAFILSGFHIFSKASEAIAFSNLSAYNDEAFSDALEQVVGARLPFFTASAMPVRLQKGVRNTGGKDNRFVAEVIGREYGREWLKKAPKGCDTDKAQAIIDEIAQALKDNFESFKHLANNVDKAMELIDMVLEHYGQFPSVAMMYANAKVVLPTKSTVAFDRDAGFVDCNTPYAVHYSVAKILERFGGEGDPAKYVQENFTTSNSSGFSWLFGSGLAYFKSHTVEEIATDYGIPESMMACAEQVKAAADAIKDQFLFGSCKGATISYSSFRSSVGGHLDSWIANYINRLKELDNINGALPEHLALPSALEPCNSQFLARNQINPDHIINLCDQLNGLRTSMTESLTHLMGKERGLCEKDFVTVKHFTDVVNRLISIRNQIQNLIDMASRDIDSPFKYLKDATKADWASWNALKDIPKLNQLRGGVPDVQSELEAIAGSLKDLILNQRRHFETIRTVARDNDCELDVYETFLARQRAILNRRAPTNGHPVTAEKLALGYFLEKIGGLVRTNTNAVYAEVIQWFKSEKVFAKDVHCNRYFSNKLGALYVSPYLQRKHPAYPLSHRVLSNPKDLVQSFATLVDGIQAKTYRDWKDIEGQTQLIKLWYGMQLSALTVDIPSDIAQPMLNAEHEEALSADLRFDLTKPSVSSSVMQRIFNLYASLIAGALTRLRREKFYLRAAFSWSGNCTLYYVPKATTWAIPKRYFDTPQWHQINQLNVLAFTEGTVVDVIETFARVAKAWDENANVLRPLLRQLPHDWCYMTPFAARYNKGTDIAFQLEKDSFKPVKVNAAGLMRLVGPNSLKSPLDQTLNGENGTTVGEMSVLIDQPIDQYVNTEGDVILTPLPYQISVVAPVSFAEDVHTPNKPTFKRIVAIDQGEMGIAFAVFNLSDVGNGNAKPIDTGLVRIPSIRALMKKAQNYRKTGQRIEKYNQSFDSTLFTMRENVAGDVCGAIVGLMKRYNAFPVLEDTPMLLGKDVKQVEMIYNMVNHRFAWSGTAAHTSERKAWWFATEMWDAPNGLMRRVYNTTDKKGLTEINGQWYKPMRIFPGTTVSEYMTSCICSHCGRNVLEDLYQLKEKKVKSIAVINGEVKLPHGTIRLYTVPDYEEARQYRRRNQNLPLNKPIKETELDLVMLRKIVKENLRRSPMNRMIKDTDQSRYYCPYIECDHHQVEQHSDINAAINIGRRLLEDLIEPPTE